MLCHNQTGVQLIYFVCCFLEKQMGQRNKIIGPNCLDKVSLAYKNVPQSCLSIIS